MAVEEEDIHAWRCSYCFKNYVVVMKQDITSNARRHLRITYSMNLDSTKKRSREVFEADSRSTDSPQIKGIITVVNVDTFRYNLTR